MKAAKDASVSKYNSLRTGVRAQAALLPWESREDYEQLRRELIDHHNPVGPTELHLVEEIAGVIWRGRRVKQAEASLYRREISEGARNEYFADRVVEAAVIGKAPSYINLGKVSLAETVGPAEDLEYMAQAGRELAQMTKIKDKVEACKDYEQAVKLLPEDAVDEFEDGWVGATDDEDETLVYDKTPAHLAIFIASNLIPALQKRAIQSRYAQDIANQLQGQAFNPEKLELIGRYETHLDRKLERMLAMLIKMQELRGSVKA